MESIATEGELSLEYDTFCSMIATRYTHAQMRPRAETRGRGKLHPLEHV